MQSTWSFQNVLVFFSAVIYNLCISPLSSFSALFDSIQRVHLQISALFSLFWTVLPRLVLSLFCPKKELSEDIMYIPKCFYCSELFVNISKHFVHYIIFKNKYFTMIPKTHLIGTGRWVEKNELTKLWHGYENSCNLWCKKGNLEIFCPGFV